LPPRVYPILDTAALARHGIAAVPFTEALLEGGARLLQFRHKADFGAAVLEAAERVAALCASAGARLIVNDRADIARLLDAGVHVGQEDLAPADARRVAGPSRWVGYSTHNEQQLAAGDSEPVDYLAIGPVFATGSKLRPDPVIGLERLAGLRRLTSKPLVAIGGITRETAQAVLATGVDMIAVIGDLMPGENTKQRVRERMEAWVKATRQ
jgi:thiamine-phosphate pyrophosphorylase